MLLIVVKNRNHRLKKKATAAAETAKEVNSEARGDVDSSLLLLTKIVCWLSDGGPSELLNAKHARQRLSCALNNGGTIWRKLSSTAA